ILQSAAGKKEKNKIISSLPSDGSSNPIASFNNFCKYTLRLNPIWDIQPPNETESQFIVTIKFFDQVILKARDARKKHAMEIAAMDAIKLLNSNGKGENLLNQLAHYAVIAKNKALYNAENIFRKYVYFDVIGMRRKEYPAV